jgi:hypothetical protein
LLFCKKHPLIIYIFYISGDGDLYSWGGLFTNTTRGWEKNDNTVIKIEIPDGAKVLDLACSTQTVAAIVDNKNKGNDK